MNQALKQVANQNSAAATAKAAGLKSLAQVSEITGVSAQTLNNWFNDKPRLFDTLIAGCALKAKELGK